MILRAALVALLFGALGPALSAETIVVAAYNVQNYLRMDRYAKGKSVKDAPKPESEIKAVVEVIAQIRPDILGLVEMGGEDMLDDLQKRLQAAGLEYPYREWMEGADSKRHVCLLSRFPIVGRHSRSDITFELDGRPQRINRGILDVTVQVNPSYQLRLAGIHLKSRREVAEYDESRMRAMEAKHVRDHLNQTLLAAPKTNLLLFGDFNDTKNEYPVRELIGARGTPLYMMDIWLRDSRGERWTHYWKTADEYSRIDYILVSPGLSREIVLKKSGINDAPIWNTASDHRALYVTVSASDK